MSYTYIMKNSFGLIKIGNSINPERRKQDLCSASGVEVELITAKRGYHLEPLIQEKLKDYKTHGEWFSCSVEQAVQAMEESSQEHKDRMEKLQRRANIKPYEEELFSKVEEPSWLRTKDELTAIKKLMLTKLIETAGSQAHLAKMLNVSPATVQGWILRGQISKSGAMRIEENPSLSVYFKPKDVRPDL